MSQTAATSQPTNQPDRPNHVRCKNFQIAMLPAISKCCGLNLTFVVHCMICGMHKNVPHVHFVCRAKMRRKKKIFYIYIWAHIQRVWSGVNKKNNTHTLKCIRTNRHSVCILSHSSSSSSYTSKYSTLESCWIKKKTCHKTLVPPLRKVDMRCPFLNARFQMFDDVHVDIGAYAIATIVG